MSSAFSTNPQRRRPAAWSQTKRASFLVDDGGLVVLSPQGQRITLPRPTPYTYPTVGTVAVAANGTTRVNLRFRADWGFVLTDLRLLATARTQLLCRIIDEAAGREWMDAPILASLIFGTSLFPYEVPQPTYCVPNQTLGFELTDTSGAPQSVQFACYGFKLSRPGSIGMLPVEDLASTTAFFQRLNYTMAAAIGARVQQVITVQNAAAFELSQANASVRVGYDVRIQSASGGVQYSTDPVAAELVFGDGQQPGNFAAPFLFPPREDIVVEATNRTAGAITEIGALCGRKIWS